MLVLWALQDVTKHIEVHIFRLAQGSGTTTFLGSGRISGLGVRGLQCRVQVWGFGFTVCMGFTGTFCLTSVGLCCKRKVAPSCQELSIPAEPAFWSLCESPSPWSNSRTGGFPVPPKTDHLKPDYYGT